MYSFMFQGNQVVRSSWFVGAFVRGFQGFLFKVLRIFVYRVWGFRFGVLRVIFFVWGDRIVYRLPTYSIAQVEIRSYVV